jgi:hypothetical protein
MKRLAMALLLTAVAGCVSEQNGSDADVLGQWKVQRFENAGMSVSMPCKPILSSGSPQDGYGHETRQFELRCFEYRNSADVDSFSLTRTTYPSNAALARENFDKYFAFVRSDNVSGPKVVIAGQTREVHADYVLKGRPIHGDLGFHDEGNECMWNFMGLDDGSEIQAVVTLPKRMCPARSATNFTAAAAKFFDSIVIDDWK